MKFLCLAYGAEKDWKALTKDEQDALLARDDVLRKRGALMAAIEPAVKTVRAWDGNPSVTAGAFAQSDVPLAGFSVIEAESIDQAGAPGGGYSMRACEGCHRDTAYPDDQ